jgi:hypothetical protein
MSVKEKDGDNKVSLLSKLEDADIYNFNSGLNTLSILFVLFTMSTSLYVGYSWGLNSSFWAQSTMMLLMGGIGFFESPTLFYTISALYYKRYSIFMVGLLCYVLLASIGYFTTSFTLDNIIHDGDKKTAGVASEISLIDKRISKINKKISNVSNNIKLSIQSYYTAVNSKLVESGAVMRSSDTNRKFKMTNVYNGNTPIWMRYCLPGNQNEFSSDRNCSKVKMNATNQLARIKNKYAISLSAYEAELTKLEDARANLNRYRGITFDNAAIDRLKVIVSDKNEKGSDILIFLVSLGVIAVMIIITSIKVFRDGKAYKFQTNERSTNIIDMIIEVFLNKWKKYSEDEQQKLLKQRRDTLVMKYELARVEANLSSVTAKETPPDNIIPNDEQIKIADEEKVIQNILDSSKSMNKHKKSESNSTTDKNRLSKLFSK